MNDLALSRRGRARETGFTLIEILVAVTIILTVAAIGVPMYVNALERARVTRAIGDISSVGKEIVNYQVSHGCWPASLADLGREALRDPWGRPYVYAVVQAGASGGAGNPGGSDDDTAGNNGQGRGGGPPENPGSNGRGRGRGNSDDNSGAAGGSGGSGSPSGGSGSGGSSAAPGCGTTSGQPRQHSGDPINRDFDLYSLGKDGQTAPSLNAQISTDDVVRGKGGSFIGLVSEY